MGEIKEGKMTRRKIVFYDDDAGSFYSTPEFNGDKTEMEAMRSDDSCDKDWADILKEFEGVKTLNEFKAVSEKAQRYYHSSIAKHIQIIPVEKTGIVHIGAKEIGKNLWLME